MNGITILIWIIIAIIGIAAAIMVKKHYNGDKLTNSVEPKLNDTERTNSILNSGKNILSRNHDNSESAHIQPNKYDYDNIENNAPLNDIYEEPAVYEVENNANLYNNVKYESQNQVLIDYGNTVEKFQEPIKQSQMDIMTQNNNEKHELKDLFTIDELIKESKRKDSEREKETRNAEDDKEINELKESIKQKQENKTDDALIEEIIANEEETITQLINETEEKPEEKTASNIITETKEETKEETISNIITETTETSEPEETVNDLISSEIDVEEKIESEDSETPIVTSQDIEEAITTASQEVKEEPESISESAGITDVLLDNVENKTPKDEIKEPILKTPTKVDETKSNYESGAGINSNNNDNKYDSDLDYRKDLAKITNTIKGSKLFKDVKDRLTLDEPEAPHIEEDFIRNVNEYDDDFAPIINETHSDFEATYEEYHRADFDDGLRQENSEKVFSIIKDTPEKPVESSIPSIKEKPSRDNIKIQINNNEVVLKKGDEIIFNHLGETYSSQVYSINGDDISVKYRRQNITIKPSDVKKVY
ncbi:hypothetical protein [Methanobrevibacter sp.]|uniref:hypothetical protein n=1 Tax=Methanobrevibacter sp. TaxID=66852 RepID=UPI003865F265